MSGFLDWLFGGNRTFYRTRVASRGFEFEFSRQRDGSVRIYIDKQPSYGSRSDDLQSTHRYYENGRYYVCIRDELKPRNDAEARAWADYFADHTSQYIKTGQHFS